MIRVYRWLLIATCWLNGYVGSLAQQVSVPKDTAYIMALLRKAEAIEMQQPEKALRDYQTARAFASRINYQSGYFESVRLIAYLFDMLGRHRESEQLATEALQVALRDTSRQYRSMCYFALAQSAKWQGKNKAAIRYFELAAPYFLAHPNRKKAAALHQNLGLIYEAEELYPQAMDHFREALRYDRLANTDSAEVAIDYQSMASVYAKQGQLFRALAHYQQSNRLLKPQRDLYPLGMNYGNMANLYKELARYDSSLYFYSKARRLNQQMNNPRETIHLLAGEAETYNQMQQYGRAKRLLDEAYALATRQQVGVSEWLNIYREYANATEGLGDYKATIGWYNRYMTAKDSLSSREGKELLAAYEPKLRRAEAKQALAEKQSQIARLEQSRQRQNFWIAIAVLVGFSALTVAGVYVSQRQRLTNQQLLTAQRSQALAIARSELQGQQNERRRIAKEMHDDMGASLTAIGLLSEVAKTRMGTQTLPEVEKIAAISAEMVTTMNEIVWSLNTKNDSLNGLIAYTRAYASEFIDNTTLALKTQISESPQEIMIRGTIRRNIFLTVKEALNNVVKHAQATEVRLTIRPDDARLWIEVADNGRGFVPGQRTGTRNGLSNMQQRMAESGGVCQILSSASGTSVQIDYPYVSTNEGENTPNDV